MGRPPGSPGSSPSIVQTLLFRHVLQIRGRFWVCAGDGEGTGMAKINWMGAAIVATLLASCGPNSQSSMFQVGQVVGGGTRQIPGVAPVGHFLPDASLLMPGGPGRPDLVYAEPQANLMSYRQILLDPIVVLADPGSDFSKVPPQQQQALADTFYSELYKNLSTHCTMTTAASPNTLRIRIALADAKATNPVVTTIATYAPYVGAAYSLEALTLNHGVGYFAGTATAEGYATDAVTGALVWEGVDSRGGTTAVIENTTDRWLDVHHVLTAWSGDLATKLQRLGACHPS
jgi:hypothetical protein